MDNDIFPLMSEEEEKILVAYWAQNAEEWAQSSGPTLRAIFESSMDGFIMFSPETRVVIFNRVANEITWKIFGKELHSGDIYSEQLNEKDIPEFISHFERALRGEIIRVEHRTKLLNDQVVWIHSTYNPVLSEDGQVQGVCLTASDITKRKEIEESLVKDQGLINVLIEGLKDYAFYLLDDQGRVAEWNSGARRLLGYEEIEVLGRDISCFFTHSDQGHSFPQFALVMAGKHANYEKEGWRVRKDGSRFWVHSVMSALHNPEGELIGYAEIIRDVSERKNQDEKSMNSRSSTLNEF